MFHFVGIIVDRDAAERLEESIMYETRCVCCTLRHAWTKGIGQEHKDADLERFHIGYINENTLHMCEDTYNTNKQAISSTSWFLL